jgi:uncharacterized pyridoxamine 5'-phosphate oxidase family protein
MEKEITIKDLVGLVNKNQVWEHTKEYFSDENSKTYSTNLENNITLELEKYFWSEDNQAYHIRTTYKGTILKDFQYILPRGKVDEPENEAKKIIQEKYDFVKELYLNQQKSNNKINKKEGLEKLHQILGKK